MGQSTWWCSEGLDLLEKEQDPPSCGTDSFPIAKAELPAELVAFPADELESVSRWLHRVGIFVLIY